MGKTLGYSLRLSRHKFARKTSEIVQNRGTASRRLNFAV